jgi:hypothetical protein
LRCHGQCKRQGRLTCATFLGNDGNDIHEWYPLCEFMSLLIKE